jgi:hypothetical protein
MHLLRAASVLLLVSLTGEAWGANAWLDAVFSDRWKEQATTDKITDEKVLFVSVATSSVNRKIGFNLARVYLECRSHKPRMVIEWDFKAAGSSHLVAEYRFAGKPGRAIKVRYVNRALEETTNAADIRQFVSDAIGSDTLTVRVNSDLYGINTAEFRTKAGASMAQHFGEACPSAAP